MADLFGSLDPISLILSQNSLHSDQPLPLQLVTDGYTLERGPRYAAYAELRDSKLRMKREIQFQIPEINQTPPKKQVKFQTNRANSRKGFSAVAQSVPDFSATLRKENRKPAAAGELTPPAKKWSNVNTILSNSRGSKSAGAGEKRNGLTRKSYANVEELKGLSIAAAAAINKDNIPRRGTRRTVLGYRQL